MKQKFSQIQTQQDSDLLEEGRKRAEKEEKNLLLLRNPQYTFYQYSGVCEIQIYLQNLDFKL